MRFKLAIIFFCCFIFLSKKGNAAKMYDCKKDSLRRSCNFTLKTDLFFPVFTLAVKSGIANALTVEKLFKRRHSVQLTFFSFSFNHKTFLSQNGSYIFVPVSITEHNYTFMFIPEYKFFISKKRDHSGYYLGTYFSCINSNYKQYEYYVVPAGYGIAYQNHIIWGPYGYYVNQQQKEQNLAIGFINGFQCYFFSRLVVDALAGAGIMETITNKGSIEGYYKPQLSIRLAFNVGYKF